MDCAGTGLCVGLHESRLQLRVCNPRSMRQRWSMLIEKGLEGVSAEETALNLQRSYNASPVCEIGMSVRTSAPNVAV